MNVRIGRFSGEMVQEDRQRWLDHVHLRKCICSKNEGSEVRGVRKKG